jgi:hypothetical protein
MTDEEFKIAWNKLVKDKADSATAKALREAAAKALSQLPSQS